MEQEEFVKNANDLIDESEFKGYIKANWTLFLVGFCLGFAVAATFYGWKQ